MQFYSICYLIYVYRVRQLDAICYVEIYDLFLSLSPDRIFVISIKCLAYNYDYNIFPV